jgi:hypothetical protein
MMVFFNGKSLRSPSLLARGCGQKLARLSPCRYWVAIERRDAAMGVIDSSADTHGLGD